MTDTEKKLAAKKFSHDWAGRGDEKQDTGVYGFWGRLNDEASCVAELMKMYQKLTKQ